ncbi:MAG: hypothetical protein ACI4JB_01795 [Porcipelethomonas sp.]
MKGIYQFAGFPAEIRSIYSFVHEQCCDYKYNGPQKHTISITTSMDDIEHERQDSGKISMTDKIIADSLSAEYLESLAVYHKLCDALSGYGCLLIHGVAAIAYGGVYLFIDRSEKDKIPLSKLQFNMFGKRTLIADCGRPLIKLSGGSVYAYGTPWCGKNVLEKNSPLPLRAICIFGDEDDDSVRKLSVSEIYADILRKCYHPFSSAQLACTVSTLEIILRKVGLYSLGRRTEPTAAIAEYQKNAGSVPATPETDAV